MLRKTSSLILLALLGLATGVRGQDCDLTIHLSTGETVTIPHAGSAAWCSSSGHRR